MVKAKCLTPISCSAFGLTNFFRNFDIAGWVIVVKNLTIFGKQPVGDVMRCPEWLAISMNDTLCDMHSKKTADR